MKSLISFCILLLIQGNIYCQIISDISDKINTKNYFIENKGQWDQNILFLARTNGINVWLTRDALVFDFQTIEHQPYTDQSTLRHPKDPQDSVIINGHVIRMEILHENAKNISQQEVITGTALEQYHNYFTNSEADHWVSNVQLYNSVLIRNYLPGIDLNLYFDDGKFRYDLISKTGTDPNKIKLKFGGQDELMLNDSRSFYLQTSLGKVSHSELNVFQSISGNANKLESGFVMLSEDEIGIRIGNFDPLFPVTIDPLVFSSFLGGSNLDYGIDIDIDRYGAAVVGGVTQSTNFPVSSGAYRQTAAGGYDIFITKFNTSGSNIAFSSYLGGSGTDYLYALALDYNGNCYITGYSNSFNYPRTTGCYQGSIAGSTDAIVTKMNAGGTSLVFSTYIGGWYIDYAHDIEVDPSYNIYIAGRTSMLAILQTNYPTTSGAYSRSLRGDYDAFLTKINGSGTSLIYSTYIGGTGADYCYDVAVDGSGNAYITGLTQSSGFPRTSGCFQNTFRGTQDVFVTKFNTTGTALDYSTFLGGTSTEQGNALIVDGSGYLYITGRTYSSNFPIVSGAYRTTAYGGGDCFITKMNTSGTALSYSTYFGGTASDFPTDIAVDINNNSVITGYTNSTNLPVSFCAYQTTNGGSSDLFVAALNPTLGSLVYSSYFGGNSSETGGDIVVNGLGEAFITGYSNSANFPTTSGSYDPANNGGIDAIVTKMPYIALGMNYNFNQIFCAGTSLTIPFTAGCSFNSGNVFTVQLSNSSGSFASPVILGSVTRQTSGTVNCKIPDSTSFGTQYRIRMVSTSPATTSLDNGFNLNINPKPIASFTMNKDTQCLNINNFQFTDMSTITKGTLSNLWDFGDKTTSNQTNSSHIYGYDSNFNVLLVSTSDSGCSDSAQKMVSVLETPDITFTVNDSMQCNNYNRFSFNSQISISSGTYSQLWHFGDGDTSSIKNPVHSYNSSNTYNVILESTASNGCTDSFVRLMVVLPSPNSAFSVNDSAQCLNNNNYIFTNTSTISIGTMSFLWIFGDGNQSSLTNATHVYATPAIYDVLLVSTSDSGCIDTAIRTINLAERPVAGFSVNSAIQCFKENSFAFTNLSTINNGNISYIWDFGDGVTDTVKNPVHTYFTDGTFNVRLTAYSSSECTDTISLPVTVRPSPVASFSVNDTDQCFNENAFVFTNSSTIKSGSLSYTWLFGDGATTTSIDGYHTYSSDKIFQVSLISTSNLGCKDTSLRSIVVFPSPQSNYFVTDTGLCFDRNFFSFSNNSVINSGSMRYKWIYGDSKSDTIQSPSHIYTLSGDYFVMLIATSDKNCKDTFGRMIHVYPMPVAGFNINDPEQCLRGNNFICTNTSSITTGALSYSWNFGDVFLTGITHPSHAYANPQKYNILLIATSQYGCPDSFILSVTVNMMPDADFSVGKICLDEPEDFTNLSFINNPDSIIQNIWAFGDGNFSSDKNPSYTYTSAGSFTAMLTVVSNNGCRDSIRKSIFITEHVSAPVLNRVSVRHHESDIEIEWSKPADGEVKNYVLEKSTDNIVYQPLTYPTLSMNKYIDASAEPHEMSYYYRIRAIDSCDYNSPYSNIGKSVFLSVNNVTHIAEISWTAYEQWPEGVNRYEIEAFNNNISDFIYVATVDENTFSYNDDKTALNQSEYCYRVAAVRNSFDVRSYSNTECVTVTFACFIPNAFTPNGDGLNDTLRAAGTSVTIFNLIIFDRWGSKVFESNDIKTGWDGTFKGKNQPEGYYYYQMSARGVKNSRVILKGTLFLTRPKQ